MKIYFIFHYVPQSFLNVCYLISTLNDPLMSFNTTLKDDVPWPIFRLACELRSTHVGDLLCTYDLYLACKQQRFLHGCIGTQGNNSKLDACGTQNFRHLFYFCTLPTRNIHFWSVDKLIHERISILSHHLDLFCINNRSTKSIRRTSLR